MLWRNPSGPLRARLEATGRKLEWVTVLAAQNDPFRVDTPAGHRDGKWLRAMWNQHDLTPPKHLRGLHYILIGQPKPDGKPYTNTNSDWEWLGNAALKAARWLGYIPWDWIKDERNEDPIVRLWTPPEPVPYAESNLEVPIPGIDDLTPAAGVLEFDGTQPYHLVLVGEKSSLAEMLEPIAEQYQADLYCMTGELSDTRIYDMARHGAADGRRMVVLYFADCDPAGWQMPISVARKLQAFEVTEFPDLDFRVDRVALTPGHVREYGLPSTPLKPKEKRAPEWFRKMGVRQTEIDALAALQPNLLRDMAIAKIEPFFDDTLAARVEAARTAWQVEADDIVMERIEPRANDIEQAAGALAAKRAEIQQILDSVRIDADEIADWLPEPEIPDAELPGEPNDALCDSDWHFITQCRALIASKTYEDENERDDDYWWDVAPE